MCRFLRWIILGFLLVVRYDNLWLISASPILSNVNPSDSAARFLVGRIALPAASIDDTGKAAMAQGNRGAAKPGGAGIISQQEQPPQGPPTDSPPCTMLIGNYRQADALGTESTAYSQMNDATMLDAGASSTSAQAVLFSAGGVPRPNVVWPILSGVVMDLTSTYSTTLGSALGTPSASTTSNDASHDRDIPPATAPHPTRTAVTAAVTTALARIECFQKRSEASKLRRQEGDPSYGPEGPPSPPPPPPPAHPPPPSPLPDSSCSSSSSTSTSSLQVASTSNSAPFDEKPLASLSPTSQWVRCAGITALAFMACLCIHWMLCNARRSTPVPIVPRSDDIGSPPEMSPFTGSGRTCGSMCLRFKSLIMKCQWWRKVVIDCASARFVAGVKRTEKPIDDSESVSESKIPC